MPPLRVTLAACAGALAMTLVAGSAGASPSDVLADYERDGQIDASHTVADLRSALAETADGSQYDSFRRAVQRKLDERLLGLERVQPKPAPEPAETPPPAPVPRSAPDPGDGPVLSLTPQALARENPVTRGADDVAGLSAVRELPQPPQVAPGSEVPLAFLVLSGAAGLLVVAGAGSAGYRRLGRSHRASEDVSQPGDE